jgi:hypothetical protein
MKRSIFVSALCACIAAPAVAARAQGAGAMPPGYWSPQQARAVLDRTLTVRLAPSLDALNAGERTAVQHLIAAGDIVQRLYESSLHPEALSAHAALLQLDARRADAAIRDLLDLYRIFQGPIAVTPANVREPFLPVAPESPGRNVYPEGITRAELDAFLASHGETRADLLDERTVVRRATATNLRADLAAIARHPELDALHPGLRAQLEDLLQQPAAATLYAAPYSVAYADELAELRDELHAAAAAVAPVDADFAQYLRLRARDLQADDYEGGDAAWVRGRLGALNAQIGSFETYDDKLYGAKSFFSLSVLLHDGASSAALARATAGLQRLQDALPYAGHKRVSDDIPLGVYDVIADFGQARGTNTATILPNDPEHARKYGRTILIRRNVLANPALFAEAQAAFGAAIDPARRNDLSAQGELLRVLWHEIGHYLGPDHTASGDTVAAALAEYSDLFEELKADLVSLWSAPAQRQAGTVDAATLRAWYASGVRRVLQKVQPLREQPYQTMQLMQMNYFLQHGLLAFRDGVLHIDYDAYPAVVAQMLGEVLKIQAEGDRAAAGTFVEGYAIWKEELQGALATRMEAASSKRYRLVRYGALGE